MKMKKKKKKLLLFRLIFLIVFITSNTLAWFIYVTKVNNNVNVHVRSWDVLFQSGDKEISNTVDVDVDSLYPGMEDYVYEITAYNKSEVSASLSYVLLEANILGNQYITVEGRDERNETVLPTDLTSAQLENKFKNDFPFKLSIDISNESISEENGTEQFSINVIWPFEGESDIEDTKWGIDASNYKKNYPTRPSITLKVKVQIIQNNE